jgi:hypothetical protein
MLPGISGPERSGKRCLDPVWRWILATCAKVGWRVGKLRGREAGCLSDVWTDGVQQVEEGQFLWVRHVNLASVIHTTQDGDKRRISCEFPLDCVCVCGDPAERTCGVFTGLSSPERGRY